MSDPHANLGPMLTDDDQTILDFEDRHWKYAGAKEAQIREQFGFSATRYYQVLNHLLDQPEALAYAPMTVRRLRRMRERRRRARSAS
jgi:hypothetical protein